MDYRFVYEEESAATASYDFKLDVSSLSAGEHMLAVNLLCLKDYAVGCCSRRFIVERQPRPKNVKILIGAIRRVGHHLAMIPWINIGFVRDGMIIGLECMALQNNQIGIGISPYNIFQIS